MNRDLRKTAKLMFSPDQENHPSKAPVKYGELIVLGYNGSLPNGDRGRRKSRFALFKRPKANGVKPSTVHIACTPQAAKMAPVLMHFSVNPAYLVWTLEPTWQKERTDFHKLH